MPIYYSYVVTRDFGFAPNPFGGFCTLATCKQRIRKSANVDDWIFGITSRKLSNRLLYAMKVNEKLTYDEYWNDNRFQYKKPIMNGSLKQMYGDNIYYYNKNLKQWHQQNSHHSLDNGVVNQHNLTRDTSGKYVLISKEYYYFGEKNVELPISLKDKLIVGINHRITEDAAGKKIIKWLKSEFVLGYHADPISFANFKRYDGKS
ncbi:MAG: hypothetical protein KDC90_12030 [Ignavibacteriae bacterium]|nr:hypothetical protein [Ignavibacteriota bacterium]